MSDVRGARFDNPVVLDDIIERAWKELVRRSTDTVGHWYQEAVYRLLCEQRGNSRYA